MVVAIRRSAFGRRLLAIRDSEAACATFGLNLLGTRLAVFMLSAAIAGLGGALYATQLQSIAPTNFDFVTGLPIFMLVVIGGAGFVGGALFAGVALYGILPLLAAVWPWFANIETLTPGVAGIGLGKQPSGAAPQFSAGFAPLRDDTPVLIAMLVAMAVVWVPAPGRGDHQLADGRCCSAWPWWRRSWPCASGPAPACSPPPRPTPPARPRRGSGVAEVPLEWVGVTVPWTEAAPGRDRRPPPPREREPGPRARGPGPHRGRGGGRGGRRPCRCLR